MITFPVKTLTDYIILSYCLNHPEPVDDPRQLSVTVPDDVLEMLDIEDFTPIDSDTDEVINFESFSSDSESSGEWLCIGIKNENFIF